ncbi:MAG TPA: 2-amino-4-hydroxy-6-hydroxymethyldihydropteridine diphosphokinase [Gammaproteobacteria bacterium]|nr:2-amino-4-hydroxy-6-hydroxymethyldihydropteridine diphosphokinase [Gammaproteobacteria bacterium]
MTSTAATGVLAAVGIGSNLADPAAQVRTAIAALATMADTELLAASSLYRNPPMGPQDQPDFVNAAVLLRTRLEPLALLDRLQEIERRQGRVRDIRWGPRTIDLDLLLYGERVINEPRLTTPHPGLHERAFVLYPLAEIAPPGLMVPGRGRITELVAACSADGLVRLR